MDRDALVGLFLEAATLKRMPRAGWFQRGVPHVESVAEHSFGVAFISLALADVVNGMVQGPVERCSIWRR